MISGFFRSEDELPEYKGDQPEMDKFPTGDSGDVSYGQAWEQYAKGNVANVLVYPEASLSAMERIGRKQGAARSKAGIFDVMPRDGKAPLTVFMNELGQNSELKEHLKDPRVAEAFGNAAIGVGRSSIATIGFDPAKTVVDLVSKRTSLSGATFKRQMYANFGNPNVGATIAHESIHNGLAKLMNAEDENGAPLPEAEKAYKLLNKLNIPEEDIVRYIVAKKMGDPETTEGKGPAKMVQSALQKFTPEKEKMLEEVEKLAEKVWRRMDHKMGPR